MSKNGLDVTSYRGWILNDITIDEFTNLLFSEFVIGTPAFGLSRKGRDLYGYYEFKAVADYDKLKIDLLGSISFSSFDTYDKLKDGILIDADMNFTNHLPNILSEKIYIYSGLVSDNKFLKQHFGTAGSTKGKDKTTIQNEAIARKNIVEIERLFYHLRNGLAHGCFSAFEQNGEIYYVIQDESPDVISARMILKASTLQNWINYLSLRKESISSHSVIVENEEQLEEKEKIAS